MEFVLPLIVPFLIIISIGTAGFYLLKAWNNRSASTYAPYNVGRHEARVAMQRNIIRALFIVILGGVFLALFWLLRSIQLDDALLQSDPPQFDLPLSPIEPDPTLTATPEFEAPTPTAVLATVVFEPTNTATVENTATAEPTITNTPEPPTAVVSSGVGVWLRDAPSTESQQIEWLLDGTVLLLLDGLEVGDTFTWQQVQAPSGEVGWVAIDFIVPPES